MQIQSTPVVVGGRGRIACQWPQGSHLFHQAPKTLLTCPCCPKRNTRLPKGSVSFLQKTAHSGFAFETDDLTHTTWFRSCFAPSLFQRHVTQREKITRKKTLVCRSDADLNEHLSISMALGKGETHIQTCGCKSCNRFSGTQKDKLKRSCTQSSTFVPHTHAHTHTHTLIHLCTSAVP